MSITIDLRGDQVGRFERRHGSGSEIRLEGLAPLGDAAARYALTVTETTLALRDGQGRTVVPTTPVSAPPGPALHWLLIADTPYLIDLTGVPTGDVTYALPSVEGPGALPWIAPATRIATPRGPVAAEALRPGDRVITRNNGIQPLVWCARIEDRMPAIRLEPGALGRARPETTLVVSAGQHVLIGGDPVRSALYESEVLARAEGLLAMSGVSETSAEGGVILALAHHALIMGEGAVFDSLYPDSDTLRALGPDAVDALSAGIPVLRSEPVATGYPLARPRLGLSASQTLAAVLEKRGGAGRLRSARMDGKGKVSSFTDTPVLTARPPDRYLN